MSFIKLQGTTLFDGTRMLKDTVLIITPEGRVEAVVPRTEAGDDVKIVNGLLSPGFINCHCHLELSHMKGIIETHTGLLKFVNQVVSKRNDNIADLPAAIEKAENEMLEQGIVAVGDICNTTDTLSLKAMGRLYYHNFVEVIGFEPAQAQEHFNRYKLVYDDYCRAVDPRQVSLTPHAPYSVSTPLWQLLTAFPGNRLLSIHNQETPEENEWFLKGTGGFSALYDRLQLQQPPIPPEGKTSIQTYGAYLNNRQQALFIHNVFTSAEDIRYIKKRVPEAFWCLCPNANSYISNRLPDIPMMMEQQVPLVLGTDSLASNYSLSIWDEIRCIQKQYPQLSLELLLTWATLNGARALQIADRYGSFEKGKSPGVLQIAEDQVCRLY
ncbi:amidohydrolase family protein [Niabella beijingensis]|uniref:amidohydrolase family protein n=1 Tax=Niabella beijingensis TaxID=2872700 RepID=UPI001CBEC2F1|nr:amidohydrolase family protein [Niabella beijingensis]MBZ4189836.1 amidohydrolase family protein [Niabella beijingensis]